MQHRLLVQARDDLVRRVTLKHQILFPGSNSFGGKSRNEPKPRHLSMTLAHFPLVHAAGLTLQELVQIHSLCTTANMAFLI